MAKREDLEKGTRVRIKDILKGTETERKYSINQHMRKMQGKVFPIHDISGPLRINIYCNDSGRTYVFHPDDLELVSPPPPIPPASFDPKDLYID